MTVFHRDIANCNLLPSQRLTGSCDVIYHHAIKSCFDFHYKPLQAASFWPSHIGHERLGPAPGTAIIEVYVRTGYLSPPATALRPSAPSGLICRGMTPHHDWKEMADIRRGDQQKL
jgi:hypothetical protein